MKKKELLKRIEKLESLVLVDSVCKNEDETIYVPDGILDIGKEIINGNITLFHDDDGWNAMSDKNIKRSKPNQFKIVPCKREDLKVGDVAFRMNDLTDEFTRISNYCLIIDDGYQYWNGRNCVFGNDKWNHWYKVVEA